ncbi:invasion associated locus B family protein [Bradyrhizobium tropiciagri]|uniref:invasion associated locus B family protein n=1 Tax=Bradyrhizobium tropiciagri TaxID=312253 RepID=UPI001BA7AA36|nr:invasion associated locus B family protein [Bradyrhizobium tropiciagri]MBR0874949.1 invasion associated locus B family protein [Bradyrhizobium tropiciagri]
MSSLYRSRGSLALQAAAAALAGLLLLAADSNLARSQQAPPPGTTAGADPAEVPTRGQRPPRPIKYGDWQKFCFKAGGAKTLCRTTVTGTFETGQTAVRVDLIEREDGDARLQLFVPVGMYLQAGIKLSVDKNEAYRIPYTWCVTNGCIAAQPADSKLVTEMESGQVLALEVVDSNILSVTTSIPLARFGPARHGPAALSIDQKIDE